MHQNNTSFNGIVFVAILLAGGIGFSLFAEASDSVTDLSQANQDKADSLKDDLDAINAKIKAYKDIIELKERQGATLSDQIIGLQAQVDKLELEIDTTAKKIQELEVQIRELSLRITEKTNLIDRQKKILAELMRFYYTDYSGDTAPIFLTSAESLLYFKSESWTANVSDKVSELLDSVRTLRDGLAKEQEEVTVKKAEVDTLYQSQAEQNRNLLSAKQSKAALLVKTQADQTKYSGLVDDLQKQRDDLENEIQDLESGLSTSGLPGYSHGLLAYPVKKVTITQGYGKTSFSKKAYVSGKHNGIDFGGSYGTSIYAAASGKVVGTGDLGKYAYGRWIAIDHGNGIVTLYGHLSSIGVSKGEKVDKGEQIGKMGSTGYSTGTHLHFTVFSADSYDVVPSSTVKGLNIPIGATVSPLNYLP
ncbi:MAG: peptidoglycan DD-metalloendopeptidase family protein [Candidatus Moranbacteria bacterium]|jgi:murein DD-endopeptidase MepM/ murein hydrolase activator NlpD|nr:peptidoglycan DD-metalloendopeptidase family protein [Candidatus Moranbacteria bacterium]